MVDHPTPSAGKDPRILVVNILIVGLVCVVAYLSYALIKRHIVQPPMDPKKSAAAEVIQLDVLNGCGAQKAATVVTTYLRDRGFDVVEMRNYKTFDVKETMVVDRRGDLKTAEQVAYALGVKKQNIIQELSHDYFVDVSVVIGSDFNSLKPSQ